MDAGQRRGLREEAADRGIRFSVHAPHAANPVRADGAAEIRRSIEFAGDVAAGVVNIHLFSDRGAKAFADALGPLLEAAGAVGVRLSLENTVHTSPDDFNAVFGTSLTLGTDLVEVYSGGMANGSARGLEITTRTGRGRHPAAGPAAHHGRRRPDGA